MLGFRHQRHVSDVRGRVLASASALVLYFVVLLAPRHAWRLNAGWRTDVH